MSRLAIGVVRVSHVGGREGESFASPGEQRDRIKAICERDGLTLLRIIEELDVSGGTPLEERHGLREAIEAVEAGEADVIVAAYFDRLVRSLRVQGELVTRVEKAGGRVLAADVGQVTGETAGQWLSGTALGMMAEYMRLSTAERTAAAQARAVARGVAPWPNVTPGYRRGDDGVYVPDPKTAAAVAEAFRMRADGAIVADVRSHLAAHGVTLSYHGVCHLLTSRVVLGEVTFGELSNPAAHEPIVDGDIWRAVQRVKVPRGRRAKSDRLLARLGVLRCGTCGSQMVIGAQNRWPFYRCNRVREDCPQRVAISAPMVEEIVTDHVRRALEGMEGRASADRDAQAADTALEHAQAELDAAIRAFAALQDEPVALERLTELRELRDAARGHAERLRGLRSALVVNASRDWDLLGVPARRALIRAVVARVVVAPGRGGGRVTVELVE